MTVLFVVATIIVFLAIEALVRRVREKRSELVQEKVQEPRRGISVRMPDGIFFARSHTWLNLFPSGRVRVGVDDFVGRLLDRPTVSYLKSAGDSLKRGEPILVLKEGERALTVRAPMDGAIISRNDAIERHPELLKEMLFTEGWAYTIRPNRPSELRQMLLGQETSNWIADEFRRLRDVFAGVTVDRELVPALLQDGGAPVAGALKHMTDDVWERFERAFLCEPE